MAVASDATPAQLGLAAADGMLTIRLPRVLPIYQAEYLAALLMTTIAPPSSTLYVDNMAVVFNLHKGRCPTAWLPFVSRWFAQRTQSVHTLYSYKCKSGRSCQPRRRVSRVELCSGFPHPYTWQRLDPSRSGQRKKHTDLRIYRFSQITFELRKIAEASSCFSLQDASKHILFDLGRSS